MEPPKGALALKTPIPEEEKEDGLRGERPAGFTANSRKEQIFMK